MEAQNFHVELCLADQVRLNKAVNDTGIEPQKILNDLIHDFLLSLGVKNPSRKSRKK